MAERGPTQPTQPARPMRPGDIFAVGGGYIAFDQPNSQPNLLPIGSQAVAATNPFLNNNISPQKSLLPPNAAPFSPLMLKKMFETRFRMQQQAHIAAQNKARQFLQQYQQQYQQQMQHQQQKLIQVQQQMSQPPQPIQSPQHPQPPQQPIKRMKPYQVMPKNLAAQKLLIMRQFVPINGQHPLLVAYSPPSMFQQLVAGSSQKSAKEPDYLQHIPSISSLSYGGEDMSTAAGREDSDSDCDTASEKEHRELVRLKEEVVSLKQQMKDQEIERLALLHKKPKSKRSFAGIHPPVQKLLKSISYPSLATAGRFMDLMSEKPVSSITMPEVPSKETSEDMLIKKIITAGSRFASKFYAQKFTKTMSRHSANNPFNYPTGKLKQSSTDKLPKLQ